MALIPVLSPWLVLVPHALYLSLFEGLNPLLSLAYLLSYFSISSASFTAIYDQHLDVHPYAIGLSVFLGYLTLQAKGIIFGPLIISAAYLIY